MSRAGWRGSNYSGASWIRPAKRWAIYARSGLQCDWCEYRPGWTEPLDRLSLDHVETHVEMLVKYGRPHHGEDNLLTACLRCNVDRGDTTWIRHATQPWQRERHRLVTLAPIDVDLGAVLFKAWRGGMDLATMLEIHRDSIQSPVL